jgi:hypothetical protein
MTEAIVWFSGGMLALSVIFLLAAERMFSLSKSYVEMTERLVNELLSRLEDKSHD